MEKSEENGENILWKSRCFKLQRKNGGYDEQMERLNDKRFY